MSPPSSFLGLSAALTGFDEAELQSTGMVDTYWQTVEGAAGPVVSAELIAVATSILSRSAGDPAELTDLIRTELLSTARLGPVARSLIQLWYLGSWVQLPDVWRDANGIWSGDSSRVVSAAAYEQSLVYQVMRAHPPGALQPGYGSWAKAPLGPRAGSGEVA